MSNTDAIAASGPGHRAEARRQATPDPVTAHWAKAEQALAAFSRIVSGGDRAAITAARRAYEDAHDAFLKTTPTTIEGLALQIVAAVSGDADALRNRDLKKVLKVARGILLSDAKATLKVRAERRSAADR
jgi:hypothetical protein